MDYDNANTDALVGMALILHDSDDTHNAIAYIEKALKVFPNNPYYLYTLADMQYDLSDFQSALLTYEKLSWLEPVNPDVWFDYSDVYAATGNYKKAIDTINLGISHQPGNFNFITGYLLILSLTVSVKRH